MVASRFVLLAIASVLLYFGLGMLLLVPGDPGGPYWAKQRVVYGVVPFVSGLVVLAISTWTATLDGGHADPVEAIKRSALYAVAGVVLVFVCLAVNDSCVHVKIRIP